MTSIYFDSKQRYGSPRITAELASLGTKLARPESSARTREAITVAKYMNQLGLRSKLSKKLKVTTNSKHNYLVVPNVLNREFLVAEPSKVWVSIITSIHTKQGFLYLTTVLDLYDRKIIGWSLGDGMGTGENTLAAWKMAVTNKNPTKVLIFHSDRGIQYASKKITNVIDSYKIKRLLKSSDPVDDPVLRKRFENPSFTGLL